jgi:peptide/nickel transport system substrate-binding protein
VKRLWLGLLIITAVGCRQPVVNPHLLVVGVTTGPNNLDPRFGQDEVSARIQEQIFDTLLMFDAKLRPVPRLASAVNHPDPLTYVVTLREGVRFHDGHELTSADVVHTFRSLVDPALAATRSGAFRSLASVEARGRYAVTFRLNEPYTSFPINFVAIPIVPDGAGPDFRERPVGTGPYRFVRSVVDDRVELAPFADYWNGAPKNDGLIVRVVPDEVMRGLELRKGSIDVVVNDISPDILVQLQGEPALQSRTGPGADLQYLAVNIRDPLLGDRRVRQAIAHAIDREAIVNHLRRGFARLADSPLPSISWAHEPDVPRFSYDPTRAKALLDEAGHLDPDGDGPAVRFRISLKVSTTEFSRLQASVIQDDLRQVGIDVDVRTHELATLFADVFAGNFQMYALQWAGGALADPDILRRIFHSSQTPPLGFNRGYYRNPVVDRLLDEASASADEGERRRLFGAVQRIVAEEAVYICLWHKTNFVIARADLAGITLSPTADFLFLKDVARVRPAAAN